MKFAIPPQSNHTTQRVVWTPARSVALLLSLYGLALLNAVAPGLRFVSPRLNVVTFLGVLFIPLSCVLLLQFAPWKTRRREWAAALLAPFALLSCLFAVFTMWIESEVIQADTEINSKALITVPATNPPVRVYDYWTPDPFHWKEMGSGIIVCQERDILPGIRWIRCLDREDQEGTTMADHIEVQLLDPRHLRLTYQLHDYTSAAAPVTLSRILPLP